MLMERAEALEILHEHAAKRFEREGTILRLYLVGKRFPEIAQELHMSLRGVQASYTRALKRGIVVPEAAVEARSAGPNRSAPASDVRRSGRRQDYRRALRCRRDDLLLNNGGDATWQVLTPSVSV